MCSKLIFFVATLCVVNASVITINVYDDEPETEVGQALGDCNLRACEQLCRRLGFPGGVCVNGRCKCDNFKTAEDELQSPADPEEDVSTLSSCNPRECDQRCRRLKFPGGACVRGRCKCDLFSKSDDFAAIIDEFQSLRGCNPRTCFEKCHKLKFPGGVCVKSYCKCIPYTTAEDEPQSPADAEEDVSTLSSCNPSKCDQRCRRLKFPGGACVRGRCKCDLFSKTEDNLESLADLEENITSRGSCNPWDCDQTCRRLKYRGGVCVRGRCKCDILRSTEDDLQSIADLEEMISSVGSCNPLECDQRCRRLKFPGGACVRGRCKCDLFTNTQESGSNGNPADNEIEASDLILKEEEQPVKYDFVESESGETHSKFLSFGNCNNFDCNKRCRKKGFRGGICRNLNAYCECFRNRNVRESGPDDNLLNNAIDASDLMLKEEEQPVKYEFVDNTRNYEVDEANLNLNEDVDVQDFVESVDSSLEQANSRKLFKCKPNLCDRVCQLLHFDSGKCVDDRCKCSKSEGAANSTKPSEPSEEPVTSDNTADAEDKSVEVDLALGEEEEQLISDEHENIKRSTRCTKRKCRSHCKNTGYAIGICQGKTCRCFLQENIIAK